MKSQPFFSLDPRLSVCASMIRAGANIVDVGTDHAYLPIYLAKNKLINHAIASDLRPRPLLNAKKNIEKYHLSDIIETRLSDGLNEINKDKADDIIIAGMGGEVISSIIAGAFWLKDSSKHLILQPMTKDETLRNFLKSENYLIEKEIAVISSNKVYSVMLVKFTKESFSVDNLYSYIGKLSENITPSTIVYISQKIKSLKQQIYGLNLEENLSKAKDLTNIVDLLKKLIEV
ncbi:MAG: tRNA (adenine(22)-N(1))-methyltransferase [Eubacteriales bacterium SKADARSKE-1]|nr:tRNA (adenine(22)-N(1))-methyltransferase [Eubacteriales bacterium SKADARSKE-1]